jgi:predicted anti-sigma-YlaC factor YlaD
MLNQAAIWRLLGAGAVGVLCVLWTKSFLTGIVVGVVLGGALVLVF